MPNTSCENANPTMPEFFHLELHNKSNFTYFNINNEMNNDLSNKIRVAFS